MPPTPDASRLPHRLLTPLRSFFATESASGVVLLACTVVALAMANSPLAGPYESFWQTKLTVSVGHCSLSESLLHWINDGLMAVFFFVVGLEIKREVLVGELSSVRGAALPLTAALGGMLVPAGIYVAVIAAAGPHEALRGWAVPTATDIAFALGVMTLLGRRAPVGLKVFLTALAIADDLGAVLVIAFFYTSHISLPALGCAAVLLAALVAINLLGVRRTAPYLVLGIGLWLAVLESGVHATVAGVLLALTIPARRTEPMLRLEETLHPWVAFAIMPVFALANAGVPFGTGLAVRNPIGPAVFFALYLGKQMGVFSFAWLSVRLGLAQLPARTTWRELYAVSCLCGIGFTMSIFIASLAFPSAEHLGSAKLGILAGSVLSAVTGTVLLFVQRRRP